MRKSARIPLSPLLLLSVALAPLGAACSRVSGQGGADRTAGVLPEATPEPQPHPAMVRVVHAMPNEPAADIFVGDHVTFSQVEYKAVTGYREVPGKLVTFRLRPTGQEESEPMAEAVEGLGAGKHYTIVMMPSERREAASLTVVNDEMVPPEDGKAKLRVVNASPEAGRVDVLVGGKLKPLLSGVNVSAATGYEDIAPLTGTLEVLHDKTVLARLPNTHIEAGRLYTVIVLGRAPDHSGRLDAMLIDEPAPAPVV
jgi:hypothetical protein